MVDVLRQLELPFIALNPGATFRGLHDSLVNYGGDDMPMIECPHEKIAVGLAHGYAKATGKPMAVILHDLVGLLQGTMGIYYAYIDRVPVMVFGGSGPAAHERRRPWFDWIHSANVQGEAVRNYTKWDHEPRSLISMPDIISRAHRIATAAPQGPVYIALDAGLQEDRVETPVPVHEVAARALAPAPMGPDPAELRRLAQILCAAERPVMVLGYPGRDHDSFGHLVTLAELVGIGAIDTRYRLNFPNRHPLAVTDTDAIEDSDCVLFVDVKDMAKATQSTDGAARQSVSRLRPDCRVLDLGFGDVGISSWSEDYSQLIPADCQVVADTSVALPLLIEECRRLLAEESPARAETRQAWRDDLRARHDALFTKWAERAHAKADEEPISTAKLAAAVWEVVQEHDWVLTAGSASEWAYRLWDFDLPHRHPGRQLGTATQIGISLGVALAHKGTGRLVVDIQPDGDLMYDVGALWVASRYELPMLVVMFNNRAYYNDWEHQETVAAQRGTPVDRAHIGMAIDEPAPDFAAIARGFGWYAAGPVVDPSQVVAEVRKAAEHVLGTGRPALVDVVCQYR
ncbi:thiamine pyrophosphate-binding protein [Sphaerisporangium perillae]|uniref:thiamine pyrophosphate-binding protein n=1 Tax=Sphaerisporangium perillae TaxID=2935860 RepID=UPI0024355E26|nr:thiamine pyrophosphate-binding protein [Sphaerisporangium perillae]